MPLVRGRWPCWLGCRGPSKPNIRARVRVKVRLPLPSQGSPKWRAMMWPAMNLRAPKAVHPSGRYLGQLTVARGPPRGDCVLGLVEPDPWETRQNWIKAQSHLAVRCFRVWEIVLCPMKCLPCAEIRFSTRSHHVSQSNLGACRWCRCLAKICTNNAQCGLQIVARRYAYLATQAVVNILLYRR